MPTIDSAEPRFMPETENKGDGFDSVIHDPNSLVDLSTVPKVPVCAGINEPNVPGQVDISGGEH